ncbi:MAG: SMI1/KNR4 family protein [Planctomycetota bacterium]
MQTIDEMIKALSQATGIACRPASAEDLDTLEELGAPEMVVEFYARYEPAQALEYGPCICPIREIEEMCDGDGVESLANYFGLVPFGNLIDGDLLCFNPELVIDDDWPAVVRVSHEQVFPDSSELDFRRGTTLYKTSLVAVLDEMVSKLQKK